MSCRVTLLLTLTALSVAPQAAPAKEQAVAEEDPIVPFVSRPDELFVVGADGGAPERLTEEKVFWVTDWPSSETLVVRQPDGISLFDLQSRSFTPLIREGGRQFYFATVSPDGAWLAFMEWSAADRTRLYVARLRDGLIPEEEWIPVSDEGSVAEENHWSPDGNLLYYVSERDGHRCLWAQALDANSREPRGEPLAVFHSHAPRRAITHTAASPQNMVVTPDAIYLGMQEVASNIWRVTLGR